MNLGETFLNFDFGDHLWMVLSHPDAEGRIAIANLTTHGRSPICQMGGCVVVTVGEHSWVKRESCVYYRKADLTPTEPLDRFKETGTLDQSDPLSPELLRRIQHGALQSRFVAIEVQELIATSIDGL